MKKLQINGQTGAAAADGRSLTFSLWADGPAENMRFRISQGGETCWDSGRLPWKAERTFADLPLTPCGDYEVTAELYGGGETSRAEMKLYTGLMDTPWKAGWIEPEQESGIKERDMQFFEQFTPMPDHLGGHSRLRPVQELRRMFSLEALPQRAVIYASAHGVYALWLNGRRVDPRRLAPETTPYESLLYYQIYDVTGLLREGENTLRVLLADGWWIGRIGLTGHSCQYGDRLAFLGQLELNYPDRTEYIVTDEHFESRPSHICYSDLMMGEKWDMTTPERGWNPCVEVGAAGDELAVQQTPPVSVWTTLEPVALTTTPYGELVADFGQCLAGVVEITLSCPAGRVVTLDHSETLDTEGNFFRNILGRNKDQQDVVVCGEGETRFCPEFTYHGFRYVRIDGVSRDEVKSIRACVLGTALDEIGSFSCSHEGLNQLQSNIRWSTRSNMVSVPTDCPQREKAGWTGDIQVFVPTGSFNYDMEGFLSGWLGQMRLSQTEDGEVPIVIPSYPQQTAMQYKMSGCNSSAAWSDACVLVPLALYESCGSTQVLRDNLDMMERWLGFIEKNSHDYLWSEGYHFGDWMIPSYQDDVMGGTEASAKVIAACQYAVTVAAYIKVLKALKEPTKKIERYCAMLKEIRRAVREKFIHEDGTIDGGLQGLYVMALRSGAAEGELADKVAAQLDALIEANGGGLDTGFVSTPHLLDVLTEHGYEERAWKLLFRTESPSWLYQVRKGATTIWENWNAIRPDGTVTTSSYNHYSLGSVGDWIYRHVGGLKRVGAGWSEIEYSPNVNCGLEWARCSHQTPYGLACCSWQRTDVGTEVTVVVPHGVGGWVKLPGVEQRVGAGAHTFTV